MDYGLKWMRWERKKEENLNKINKKKKKKLIKRKFKELWNKKFFKEIISWIKLIDRR